MVYQCSSSLRLVLTLGICCLPSCDWFSHWVHTASPPAIGSHAGYILPPLLRLVLALGIYRRPSCDWFSADGGLPRAHISVSNVPLECKYEKDVVLEERTLSTGLIEKASNAVEPFEAATPR
eukprot:1196174-Prorocentrum_minimum.AAC.9